MQSPYRINPDQKQVMIAHIVRCRETLQVVSGILEASDFNDISEIGDKVIVELALTHWREYHKPISKEILLAQLKERMNNSALFPLEEENESIFANVDFIFKWDAETLIPDIGINLAQRFIDERRISSIMASGRPIPELVSKMSDVYNATRLGYADDRIDILGKDEPIHATAPKTATGCTFFDELLGGGVVPGEIYALLGPTGGGKTVLGLQVACEAARKGLHVVYATYECSVRGDLSTRVYSYLTRTDIEELSGVPKENMHPDVLDSLDKHRDIVGPYLHMLDFCSQSKSGQGGADELDGRIYKECEEDRRPSLVIIDWLGQMVQRKMCARGENLDTLRHHLSSAADKLMRMTKKYDTSVLAIHQLNGVASSKKPRRKPQWTDAAEAKSLSWLLNFTLALGTMAPEDHKCWLVASKTRRGPGGDKILQLHGALNYFEDTGNEFQINSRGGSGFVRRGKQDYLPDDDMVVYTA